MSTDRSLYPDLVLSFDRNLERALNREKPAKGKRRQPPARPIPVVRKSLMEPLSKDPRGWERLVGESNLVSINFLDRGRRAADAVCMIRVPAPEISWRGTGFLVAQRLLMTNHHVLGTLAEASQAEAEFGYEIDVDGVARHPVKFNLAPHEIFFTDPELDVTLVSVNRYSDADVPLDRYGRLPLIPLSGKAMDGEDVSIIQHPRGETKQIAIRASQVIDLRCREQPGIDDDYLEKFIHYSTDTQPGSSGAPVFSDNWQVIAIHHKAIPDWSKMPKGFKAQDPRTGVGEGDIEWLANEGVRVSAIYRKLERSRFSDANAAAALARLEEAIGLQPLIRPQFSRTSAAEFEADRKPLKQVVWDKLAGKLGYRADFLAGRALSLEDILAGSEDKVAPLKDGSLLLHYLHFSTAIDRERKFPLLTAVNIRGDSLFHPGDRGPWRRDIRIDDEFQPNEEFYGRDKGTVPVDFDRGHLVRRFDPCWGEDRDEAIIANDHTFHYTNTAPQVNGYNANDWGNLEDYVLSQTQIKEKRVTVFTGPIFRSDDPLFTVRKTEATYRIPISFWKIAVIERSPTEIAAVGFMNGQLKYVSALYEAQVFGGLRPYTLEELKEQNIQVPIATIEEETGLNFAALRDADTLGALEATKRVRFIRKASDILF
ncbi:DNA/RNA non-specific endonuclease [Mesorhizobium sp. KR9-304]|uniref:DNA/RNA non-specific endonuclease n=1 Tax=Mesorhizobium sp. KR9-304 TaxID=3156614 RepID=UPI0032B4184E